MREPPPRQPLTFTVSGVIASVLVLIVAATCVRLGFWQLDRMRQRRERNEQVEARLRAAPATVDAVLRDTAGFAFRRIELRGRFDDDRSIVLPGRAYQGTPGVHLLTPLLIDDHNGAVLVNRGWVPSADGATIDVDPFDTAGADTVLGGLIVALPRSAREPREASRSDPAFRRVWFTMDEDALRAQYPYPLADFVVQELSDPDDAVAHYPVRLPPPPLDAGPHLGYAVQWFSFAAIAVIGWLTLVLRRSAPRPRDVARAPPPSVP